MPPEKCEGTCLHHCAGGGSRRWFRSSIAPRAEEWATLTHSSLIAGLPSAAAVSRAHILAAVSRQLPDLPSSCAPAAAPVLGHVMLETSAGPPRRGEPSVVAWLPREAIFAGETRFAKSGPKADPFERNNCRLQRGSGMVRRGMVWRAVVWCGAAWYGMMYVHHQIRVVQRACQVQCSSTHTIHEAMRNYLDRC